MPNTSNRLVIYNDGEGLDHTDLNRHSIWQAIRHSDYEFAMLTRTDPTVATPWQESTYLKKLHRFHNAGCAYAGPSNRQIRCKRGLIAKWIAAPDGTEPKLLCYFLDEDEISLQSAVGDATNPRYDVIAIKLEWENVTETRDFEDAGTHAITSTTPTTYKRVKMTARLVAGTPAASPAIPAIAADEAYYCVYRVPATFDAALVLDPDPAGTNRFRDFTFPIGEIKTAFFQGVDLGFVAADWTIANDGTITSTGATKRATAGINMSAAEAKVLRFELAAGGTYGVTTGIRGSTSETVYSIVGANSKDFADFSAIDDDTCRLWFRKGAFTTNLRQPFVRVVPASGSSLVGCLEVHYK